MDGIRYTASGPFLRYQTLSYRFSVSFAAFKGFMGTRIQLCAL